MIRDTAFPNQPPVRRINRREALVASSACLVAAASGCRGETDEVVKPAATRSDVPLRIAMVGSEQDSEAIRRGWLSVNEQALDIQSISGHRSDAVTQFDSLIAAAEASDLLIFPLGLIGQLVAGELIVPLAGEDFDELHSRLFPTLRNGAVRFAGESYTVPLGTKLPALLTGADVGRIDTWEDYGRVVKEQWDGQAAEPTADGWAAVTFLWRAAQTAESWLFSRDDFTPLLQDEAYVHALQQMRELHRLSNLEQRPTPDQVWAAVKSGQLKGGIGFPSSRDFKESEIEVADTPGVGETTRILLDPFSPVIGLAASCRQTAASKRFMQWLAIGEGSDTVRQQVAGMSAVGQAVGTDAPGEAAADDYGRWLDRRLMSPLTLPTLQVIEAGKYYAVLDQHIIRCLEGSSDPQQTLRETTQAWQEITSSVGVEKQLRAWRRAQGMRA